MKKIIFFTLILSLVVLVGCQENNALLPAEYPAGECPPACPQISPAGPDFCKDGTITEGQKDKCGCVGAPTCKKNSIPPAPATKCPDLRPEICTMDYNPACGYFNESIKCFKYPCAATYGNSCTACADPKVAYWEKGECPN